uniref:Alternative protein MPPED2 n=1 Tax=Homo sapiens TaxID=9606 RepID=L8E791_HUMAN|nr:alternative protein MPPED2 [Homo sapiens]
MCDLYNNPTNMSEGKNHGLCTQHNQEGLTVVNEFKGRTSSDKSY